MKNNGTFETLDTDTLEGFNDLPPAAKKAYFADAKPLWPKNSRGKRVKPRKKKNTKKPEIKSQKVVKKKRRSSTRRKSRNTGFSYGQKIAIGAVGIGILTIALMKRP